MFKAWRQHTHAVDAAIRAQDKAAKPDATPADQRTKKAAQQRTKATFKKLDKTMSRDERRNPGRVG